MAGSPRRKRRSPLSMGIAARNLAMGGIVWALSVAAWLLAYQLRFDFDVPDLHASNLVGSLPAALLVKAVVVRAFNLHRGSWRYAGLKDVEAVVLASVSATAALLVTNFVALNLRSIPRSVYALDLLLAVALISGTRVAARMLAERRGIAARDGKRLMIVGGGDTGELLLRQLARRGALSYSPVVIIDDAPAKHGLIIHGVPVAGGVDSLGEIAVSYAVEEIVIAAPSASGDQIRRIVGECRETGLPFQVLPPTEDVLSGAASWKELREVQIEDLLRRAPVQLDVGLMADFLDDRVVLVTGAGGSIGSEICRQVAHWRPRKLVLVEQAENPLFFLARELAERAPEVPLVEIVADISDPTSVRRIFEEHLPAVVIHCAAHKHVPLMERNVPEAVKNNVFGTRTVAEESARVRCETFVMVSTDKAVNPTSVMGATKRVAELVVQDLGRQNPDTRFVTVRFGNVLGSRGSVVPIFRAQIAAGGPVTVTHKDMTRYFMTIPEASRLVLQAAALGDDGRLFILDMGEPVRILDLAEDLIRLSGLEPWVDIDIRFTGIRPGEKLFEDLSHAHEGIENTTHDKIYLGQVKPPTPAVLQRGLQRLAAEVEAGDEVALRSTLNQLVPEGALRKRGIDTGRTEIVRASRPGIRMVEAVGSDEP